MPLFQPAILAPIPTLANYLYFQISDKTQIIEALASLANNIASNKVTIGLGKSLLDALNLSMAEMHDFPDFTGYNVSIPSTPAALWCWIKGDNRSELFEQTRHIVQILSPAFKLSSSVEGFRHREGRDLTGYEDGTENPKNEEAIAAAIFDEQKTGLQGSSFLAIQQWLHQFERFDAMSSHDQDMSIGRRRADNEEIEDAPESSHVKRTAQESFDPEAFMFRRSMPWSEQGRAGLIFVAFAKSFYPFEAQLKRMTGQEDGITDALFKFSKPITGNYFWCPPLRDGKLDLLYLGISA